MSGDRPSRILLVSLGKLNGLLLQILARRPGIAEIIVATRNSERARPALHLARMGAAAEGFFPSFRALDFDLNDEEASAEALADLRPDVTLAAPSLQSWWVLDQVAPRLADPLRPAGFGAWLPFQLLPMIRFMKAWKRSGLKTPILSAPYPDVVNPILATHGLAPTAGVGNVSELVPKLQCLIADRLSVGPTTVRVWLVAHHALQPYVFTRSQKRGEPPPFLVSAEVKGRGSMSDAELRSILLGDYPMPAGLDFQFLTVGTFIAALLAFMSGDQAIGTHLPAPSGLPGGYPVVVQNRKARLDLPPDWGKEDAVEVNRASQRWDGIESIDEEGTVVFTDQTVGILREYLGYDWPRMRFEEVETAAGQLHRGFDKYVKGTG